MLYLSRFAHGMQVLLYFTYLWARIPLKMLDGLQSGKLPRVQAVVE